jgi:hypothetical protein
MPRQTKDETTTCDPWCHNHTDLGYGCASEPVTVAGVTSWVKRTAAGVVAVIEDEDVTPEQLADLAEHVTVLRGLTGASRP